MSRSPSSGVGFGLMAVVAMVTCCALPVLISAGVLATIGGVLATIGGVLRNPLIVAAEALGGAVAYALRRRSVAKPAPSQMPPPSSRRHRETGHDGTSVGDRGGAGRQPAAHGSAGSAPP